MLRINLVAAPIRRDVAAACQALATLAAGYPDDAMLAPARMSLAAPGGRPPAAVSGPKASVDATDARAARLRLQAPVVPAVAAVLGRNSAQDWWVPLCCDLARHSEPLTGQPSDRCQRPHRAPATGQ